MAIFIGMKKIDEDENTVSYSFDTRVVDKKYYKPDKISAYKVESHIAYGYYILNKKTEEFILDEKKTDPFFFTSQGRPYALRVGGKLLKILRSGENFPEITCYAS